MTETPVVDRNGEIFSAIDVMSSEYDLWNQSDSDDMTVSLERAFTSLVHVAIHGGAIPEMLVPLFPQILAFAQAWGNVLEGSGVDADGLPSSGFFSTVDGLIKAAHDLRLRSQCKTKIESVPDLLEQFGDDPRRWEWIADIYTSRDPRTGVATCPFKDSRGQVDISLIKKEAAEPGSVVPDPGTFSLESSRLRAADNARQQLQQLASRHEEFREAKNKVDKASIEEQLREGQYPDVIAKDKGVHVNDILAEAARLGITPGDREADLALVNPDPIADAFEAASKPDVVKKQLESVTGKPLSELVLAVLSDNPDASAPDVLRTLASADQTAELSEVSALIKDLAVNA